MNDSTRPRVVVIGSGPAGTRAAETLAAAGLRPLVIDEALRSGGQIYRRPSDALARPPRALYGFEAGRAQTLHAAFDRLVETGAIEHRPQTLVWGSEDCRLLLSAPQGVQEIAFDAVILATGAMDRIVPFPGWTLPGVYSLGGAQVTMKHQARVIGGRPVLAGTGPLLYLVAWQYAKAGARPAAVLDAGTFWQKARATGDLLSSPLTLAKGLWYTLGLALRGVPVLGGAAIERVDATSDGLAVRYRRCGMVATVVGDAVAVGHGLKPERQLAELLGCALAFDPVTRQWLVETDGDGRTSVAGVYAAGDGVAIRGAVAAEAAGELAAQAALDDLGVAHNGRGRVTLRRRLKRLDRFRRGLETAFPPPSVGAVADETVVCRCEVVRAGELRAAAREWSLDDVNRLKAVTRCGMGRCQGRLCGQAAAEILAGAACLPVEAVGALRAQIPLKPVTFAAEYGDDAA